MAEPKKKKKKGKLRIKLDNLTAEVNDLKQQLLNSEAEANNFKTRLTQSEKQVDFFKTELSNSETEVNDLKTEVNDLKTKLSKSETEVNDLKTKLSNSETEVNDLKTKLSNSETEVNDLKTKLSNSETEVNDLKTKLSNSETEVNDLKTKVNDLKTKLSNSETEVNDLKTKLSNHEKEVSDSNIDPINSEEAADFNLQLINCEEKVNNLNIKLTSYKNEIQTFKSELTDETLINDAATAFIPLALISEQDIEALKESIDEDSGAYDRLVEYVGLFKKIGNALKIRSEDLDTLQNELQEKIEVRQKREVIEPEEAAEIPVVVNEEAEAEVAEEEVPKEDNLPTIIISNEENYIAANCYISASEADQNIQNEFWSSMNTIHKEIQLQKSSFEIDGFYSYQGNKTDINQLLKFPRSGSKIVPHRIKLATAALAAHISQVLAWGGDPYSDTQEEELGTLRLKYFKKSNAYGTNAHIYAPKNVINLLRPYIKTFMTNTGAF